MRRLAAVVFSLLFGALVFGSAPTDAGVTGGVSQVSGSFTPQVQFGGVNCTSGTPCTFSSGPSGNYIKTNNIVYVQIGFAFTALGTGSGAVGIVNLPFTSQNLGADAFGCIGIYQNLAAGTDAFMLQAGVAPNTNGIAIRYRVSGVETALLASHLTSTSYIKMTCEFPV